MSIEAHQQRLQKKYDDFVASLETTPPVECEFAVGDVVTFTNEYGVSFPGQTIIGFAEDDSFYGRFIYTDSDAYWFPSRPEELTYPMTPERAKEIIAQAKAQAGCGPWSDQLDKVMTDIEREEVRHKWQTMPGYTCFVDALFRFVDPSRDK